MNSNGQKMASSKAKTQHEIDKNCISLLRNDQKSQKQGSKMVKKASKKLQSTSKRLENASKRLQKSFKKASKKVQKVSKRLQKGSKKAPKGTRRPQSAQKGDFFANFTIPFHYFYEAALKVPLRTVPSSIELTFLKPYKIHSKLPKNLKLHSRIFHKYTVGQQKLKTDHGLAIFRRQIEQLHYR